ncbi:MAG: hypothetical protein M3P83_02575 [Actinomycetota bacterium]|nr:hypothetical protein [Actinomycetota bacterium]
MGSNQHDDFYEDDEPIEDIVDAFRRGEKGVTAPPAAGYNIPLSVPGLTTPSWDGVSESKTWTARDLVAS